MKYANSHLLLKADEYKKVTGSTEPIKHPLILGTSTENKDTPIPGGDKDDKPKPPHKPIRLKNSDKAEIIISTLPKGITSDGPRVGGGKGGGIGGTNLSNEDKLKIEECSRKCVKRELEKKDYVVEEMPQQNQGFDLRATKDGNELRIEVKGHLHESNVVELTVREYEEYLKWQSSESLIKWQLWNVENLDEGPRPVIITRYEIINDEAMRGKNFSLDLRQCKPITEK